MTHMNRLVNWRLAKGLSQGAIAERLGITQGQVSRIESGARKPGRRVANAIEVLTAGVVTAKSWDAPRSRRAPASRTAARTVSTPNLGVHRLASKPARARVPEEHAGAPSQVLRDEPGAEVEATSSAGLSSEGGPRG